METVNNIASAASRAIWGDGSAEDKPTTVPAANETAGKEPVAGEMGDVKRGEPYDKGNAGKGSTSGTSSILPSHPKTTDITLPSPNLPSADEGLVPKPEDPTVPPTTSASTTSRSIPTSSIANEGADLPTKLPEADESKKIKETKTAAEEDISGPGPQSLGNSAVVVGGADGPQKKSLGTGTGEHYVESNGVKADGGDFDAKNAGAGKEAHRLLENKEINPDSTTEAKALELTPTKSADDADSPQEKKKLSEKLGIDKLKAKLHKHKE
ncbi:hypothetical protein BUE80_DR010386 [Diplocarpon rosae]|nr:hypothetical protein BUE80_DR010386 [Diplocarpon rosae]